MLHPTKPKWREPAPDDDDGDGLVTFEGVSIGLHTLEQTVPPDGYQNVGSLQVDVQGDQNFAVRHEPALEPTEVPTEETTEVPTAQISGLILPSVAGPRLLEFASTSYCVKFPTVNKFLPIL